MLNIETTTDPIMFTNEVHLEAIKEAIQIELLKRGFTAPIISIEEKVSRTNRHRISFHTENFQTVPVLFKTIQVNEFSSEIFSSEKDVVEFYIGVHVSYTHFDLGSNSSSLFQIKGYLNERGVYGIKIR